MCAADSVASSSQQQQQQPLEQVCSPRIGGELHILAVIVIGFDKGDQRLLAMVKFTCGT